MKTIWQRLAPVLAGTGLIFLASCGGGSGGGASASSARLQGTMVPAVEGAHYQTATESGYVNSAGSFSYRAGEQVHFTVGSMELASVPAGPVASPIDLSDPVAAANMARLLKAIDISASTAPTTIKVPTLAAFMTTPVDVTTDATTAASLASISPTAVLPTATAPSVTSMVSGTASAVDAVVNTSGGTYTFFSSYLGAGTDENYAADLTPSGCLPSANKMRTATLTLAGPIDFSTGRMDGILTADFGVSTIAGLHLTSTVGSFVRGGSTVNYFITRGSSTSLKTLNIKLTDSRIPSTTSACRVETAVLSDTSKPNLGPDIALGGAFFTIPLGIDGPYSYTYDVLVKSAGLCKLTFVPSGIGTICDHDGHIVKARLESSKGRFVEATPPLIYGAGQRPELVLTEYVYPGETVTITLTATDDSGAVTSTTQTLGNSTPSLSGWLDLAVGKTYKVQPAGGTAQAYYKLSSGKNYFNVWSYNPAVSSTCTANTIDLGNLPFAATDIVNVIGTHFYIKSGTRIDDYYTAPLPAACTAVVPPPYTGGTYSGVYAGSYSGSDQGTVRFTIGATGTISGTVVQASNPGAPISVSGSAVSANGQITLTSQQTGGSFTGTINASYVATGTWSVPSIGTGTFTATKQ